MVRKSQIKAQSKWEQKVYDKVLLRLRKDQEPTRDTIAAAAAASGESLNEYIINAVKNRLDEPREEKTK
jgi:uncharacterized protein (DUF1778 family)